MLRKTVTIAASLIGVWVLGVLALTLAPIERENAAAENGQVYPVNARVWSIDQDRSGRFTVYVRRPVRGYVEIESDDEIESDERS